MKYFQIKSFFLLWLFLGGLVAGCTHYGGVEVPTFHYDAKKFTNDLEPSPQFADPGEWWVSFGLEGFESMLQDSHLNNPSLKASRARLAQFLAVSDINFALIFPEMNLSVTQSQTQYKSGLPDLELNSASLGAAYEIDLFGKKFAGYSAADLDFLSQLENYKAQAAGHSLNFAKAWIALAEARSRLALTHESLKADRANLELIQQAYYSGSATLSDVLQAKDAEIQNKAALLQLEELVKLYARNLEVLQGRYPDSSRIPEVSLEQLRLRPLAPGLPSELLQRRPDLRQSLLALRAQDQRVAVAVADIYPRFTLSASTGFSSTQLSNLTDPSKGVTNLSLGLSQPLWDWGRRFAEIDRQKGVLEERLANFEQALLNAINEVESLLGQLESARKRVELYQEQVQFGNERLELSKQGFIEGSMRWDQVIFAQNQYFAAQRSLLATKKEWLETQLNLYNALGGSWMNQGLAPLSRDLQEKLAEAP